jgi:membrane protease YdiL (CAAX protease family)
VAPIDPAEAYRDPDGEYSEPADRSADEPATPRSSEPPAEPLVPCWRCDKLVRPRGRCRYCRARISDRGYVITPTTKAPVSPLVPILCILGLLIVTGVISGWIAHFGLGGTSLEETIRRAQGLQIFFTLFAGLVILVTWFVYRRECRFAAPAERTTRLATTLLALPLLALFLGLNVLYHRTLRNLFHLPEGVEVFSLAHDGLLAIVVVCLLPAWLEELFFRQLALGSLRRNLDVHSSVWISALMFGLAHTGAPLSVPYLTLLGVLFGYLRVGSGTLVLPIVCHAAHNYAVLFLNGS